MKFYIHVKNARSDWKEKYDEKNIMTKEQAVIRGKALVEYYNKTIPTMGGEERTFIDADIISAGIDGYNHIWEKRTGGMSVNFRGSTVDEMYCQRCNVTGKRFGLNGFIKRDSKYKAKKYSDCRWRGVE